MLSNFLNPKLTFILFLLTQLLVLSPLFASETDLEKANPITPPIFSTPETVKGFIDNLSHAKFDKTQTRLIVPINGIPWFITPEYREEIIMSGIQGKKKPWIAQIEYRKSERVGNITRCFYRAHFKTGYSENIDLLEFRISHLSQ
ncbi:MAG: hypothetical protein FJX03_05785 [Alphaproteobacteria bacterium]|nr:hypothetical protein [Alphaproteobacteria bacterium]